MYNERYDNLNTGKKMLENKLKEIKEDLEKI